MYLVQYVSRKKCGCLGRNVALSLNVYYKNETNCDCVKAQKVRLKMSNKAGSVSSGRKYPKKRCKRLSKRGPLHPQTPETDIICSLKGNTSQSSVTVPSV